MVSKEHLKNDIKMLKEYKKMCMEYDTEFDKKQGYMEFVSKKKRGVYFGDAPTLNFNSYVRRDIHDCKCIKEIKNEINQMKKQLDEKISQVSSLRKERIRNLENIQKLEEILRFKDGYIERKKRYESKYRNIDGYKEFCNNDYPITLNLPNIGKGESDKYTHKYVINKEDNDKVGAFYINITNLNFIENEEKRVWDFLRKQSSIPYDPSETPFIN